MVIFLVPRYCFCAQALVRNCDIRQKLTLLAMNKRMCLVSGTGRIHSPGWWFYCFCRGEENLQFHDAPSRWMGQELQHEAPGQRFLMAQSCRAPRCLVRECAQSRIEMNSPRHYAAPGVQSRSQSLPQILPQCSLLSKATFKVRSNPMSSFLSRLKWVVYTSRHSQKGLPLSGMQTGWNRMIWCSCHCFL